MTATDALRFSTRALRGHRLRSSLSLLGVGVGVASVILLTSLGEGARLFVVGEFSSLGSNLVIVIPGKTETTGMAPFLNEAPNDLTVEDAEAIDRGIARVRRVAPVSLGTAPVGYGDRRREVSVIGSTQPFLEIRHLEMGSGQWLPAAEGRREARVCVIGSKIQRELFRGENPLGKTLRVGDYRFRVIGVLAPTGTALQVDVDDMVYLPVHTGMKIFNRTSLFRILVEVRSYDQIDLALEDVRRLLIERHDGEEDVTILTQDSMLSTFSQVLGVLTAALVGIAAISLSVAGIGIMNVMLVTVVERTREIGLLKALGVSRRQIVTVFLAESTILSCLGGVAGLAAGLGIGQLARQLFPDFPIQPPPWAVVTALAVSVLVGVVFGALPARRAAGLDPVEALARR